MLIQRLQIVVLTGICLLLFKVPTGQATTIDPLIWEQFVVDAAFVGIAECETAGGIVAGYKVVESWKGGMPVGTRFTLRVATNYWGPQFPVTLVGEKYLIAAYKAYNPTRIMSTTSGTPVPLWWRAIPADYSIPLWQGRVRLPLRKDKNPLDAVGSSHPDLKSFKTAVDELLSLASEKQEIRLLQALTKKYMFSNLDGDQSGIPKEMIERLKLAERNIGKATTAREIVTELLAVGAKDPEKMKYSIGGVFTQGAGNVTLSFLKSTDFKNAIWEKEYFQEMLNDIEQRLGVESKKNEPVVAETPKPPTESELGQLRTALLSGPEDNRFGEAFEVLTVHDPEAVAEFLISWSNPEKTWQDTDAGYFIGSYFAVNCAKNREKHLLRILQAQDPFIRVAGAVYLAFENPSLGTAKLEELMQLPGDPGVWAAINLARRGKTSAVSRALQVFSTAGPYGHMSGTPHENLQLRVQILLSNSAAVSKLPQLAPPADPGYEASAEARKKFQEVTYSYYVDWWRAHQDKVQLSDPWLKVLEKQKID